VDKSLNCATCGFTERDDLKFTWESDPLGFEAGKEVPNSTRFGQHVYIETIPFFCPPQKFGGLECKSLCILQDNWSKYIQAIPISQDEPEILTQALMENWARKYGYPGKLYGNRGATQINQLFWELLYSLNICEGKTPEYSPRRDQIVKAHQLIRNHLGTDPEFRLDDFTAKLNLALFTYNSNWIRKVP